jgi:hypothetical protein
MSLKKQQKQMIHLSVTQSSEVIATLREKASNLVNPYYTWKIVNKNSFDEYIFSADNNTTSVYYDSFTLSVGTPSSLTSSVTIDAVAGQYDYFVYEMNNNYDLDLNNSLGLVEMGIMMINGTYSDIISFTESNYDTIRVFNEL